MEENQLVGETTTLKIVPAVDIQRTLNVVYKPSFYDVWPQILASCIALSSVIQPGINMAFSGILLPQLANDPNIKHFTKTEASWIASLSVISQPVGSLVAGPLMDSFGRKKICILQNIPLIASWVMVYFTTSSLWPIYIARLLSGFGGGLTLVGLVYTAEVAHVNYRAMLLSLNSVNIAVGILITTVVGVYLDWHDCALCFGALAVASFILSFFLPESPYWSASFTNNRQEDIKDLVRSLSRNNEVFVAEWQRIQEAVEKRRRQLIEDGGEKSWGRKFLDTCRNFGERSAYMPSIVLLALFIFQQFSGTYVVIFYTVNIFKSISVNFGYGFDEYSATMTLGVLRFLMSIVAAALSRVIGRRPIMIISALLMALSSCMSGTFLYLNHIEYVNFGSQNMTGNSTLTDPTVVNNWWILSSILLYVCGGSIGLMVIPWTMIGELLPIKVRAIGSGLMVSYGSLLLFLIIKTFPFFVDLVTLPGVFLNYTVMSLLCAVFVYWYLPETFGKSFDEIARYFQLRQVT